MWAAIAWPLRRFSERAAALLRAPILLLCASRVSRAPYAAIMEV